jgi:hypothetical protein
LPGHRAASPDLIEENPKENIMAKHKKKQKHHYRNAASGSAARRPTVEEPEGGQVLAALAGGAGGALLGGMAANQGWKPELISALLALGGGLAAWKTEGNWRVLSTGAAAAGAGQFMLMMLAAQEEAKAKADAEKLAAASAANAATATKAGEKPRQSSVGVAHAFNTIADRVAEIYDDDAMRFADAA